MEQTDTMQIQKAHYGKLVATLGTITTTVTETHGILLQIEQYGQQIREQGLADAARTVGNNVNLLANTLTQFNALAVSTQAVLQATVEARDAILTELNTISDALKRVDTQHPLLQQFAARITEEVNEAATWDFEDEQFAASEHIQQHMGHPPLIANYYGEQLKELMFGEYAWTEAQADLIRQLLDTFDDAPEYIVQASQILGGGHE